MPHAATVQGRCLVPVTWQLTHTAVMPVALELVNSVGQLLPSLGCELQEPGCGSLCDGLVWWSTRRVQDVTARMLLTGVFLITPDTQMLWSLHCHQNLQKTVPGGKVSSVTLGE